MRQSLWMILGFLLVSLLFPACDEDDSSVDDSPDEDGDLTDEDGDSESQDIEDAQGSVEDMTGPWAMKYAVSYFTTIPGFNREVTTILYGLARLPVEHDGRDFYFTENLCTMEMGIVEDFDMQIIFPQKTVESVPPGDRHAVLSATEEGASFHHEPYLSLFGINEDLMDNPTTDELPTETEDALVADLDNDGHPGVTARVTGIVAAEFYVVLRLSRWLDGVVESGTLIEGTNGSLVEMVTLDADPSLLAMQLELRPNPQVEVNHFQLVRLPDDYSCEEIEQYQDELFDYDPFDYAVPLWEKD